MLAFPKHRSPISLTGFSLACIVLSLLLKVIGTLWVKMRISQLAREYSYVGNDFPEVWPIERKPVLMAFDNPKHFRLDTEDGAAEWGAIAPGNGVIHLGLHRQPFTVSMLHQLKCLDIIRQEMVRDRGGSAGARGSEELALSRHCLNYVRQMVMCRGDLELESFQFASHKNPIDWRGVYQCNDWEAVYTEVKRNQEEHERRVRAS